MKKIILALFFLLDFCSPGLLRSQITSEGILVFEDEINQVLLQQEHHPGDKITFNMLIFVSSFNRRGYKEKLVQLFLNDSMVKSTFSTKGSFGGNDYFGLIKENDILEYDTSRHVLMNTTPYKDSSGYQVRTRKIFNGKDSVDTYMRFKSDSSGRPSESFFNDSVKPRLYTWEYIGDSIEIMKTYHFKDGVKTIMWEHYRHSVMDKNNKVKYDKIITTVYSYKLASPVKEITTAIEKTYYTYDKLNRLIEIENRKYVCDEESEKLEESNFMKIEYEKTKNR